MPVCNAGAKCIRKGVKRAESPIINVMEQKDINLIDEYFNGLLSEDEMKALRERSVLEPELGRAFALRAEMEQWLVREPGRKALSENLSNIGAEFFQEKAAQAPLQAGRVNNMRRWLLAAASIALLAVAVWFVQQNLGTSLYEQYAQYDPPAFTERGSETDSLASGAETAFKQKRYAEALEDLDGLLAQQPDNAVAELYRGGSPPRTRVACYRHIRLARRCHLVHRPEFFV
jgi:tetratricopeptide (TPR) repeat protein